MRARLCKVAVTWCISRGSSNWCRTSRNVAIAPATRSRDTIADSNDYCLVYSPGQSAGDRKTRGAGPGLVSGRLRRIEAAPGGRESGGDECLTGEIAAGTARRSVVDELRRAGIKPTPQRVAIYEMLKGTATHPNVEAVYESLRHAFPAMSLNTVYSSLQALVAAGLVRKLATRENIFRYDANASPHAHFVCTRCGRVEDVPATIDEALAEIEPGLEARIPRRITDYEHYFYGCCGDCEAKLERPDAAVHGREEIQGI